MSTLQQKKMEFTRNLLLDAACELAEELDISELSFKKVAQHANVSERTMFRYFTTREAFLDAFAKLLHRQLDLPSVPQSVDQMNDYVKLLYTRLDSQPRKVTLLLQSELLPRILHSTAKERLNDLITLLSNTFPKIAKDDVIKSAANIRYILSASSWRYYRQYFEFDLNTSIECVQMLVTQTLQHLDELDIDTSVT